MKEGAALAGIAWALLCLVMAGANLVVGFAGIATHPVFSVIVGCFDIVTAFILFWIVIKYT